MIPWKQLGAAHVAGGPELTLWQRGDEFAIRSGSVELMSSRRHESEDVLGRTACEGLAAGARVLIGGLGMGFTLRAALDVLASDARVEVAELVPAVVDWVRGPLASLAGHAVEDPRVQVQLRDVAIVLRETNERYDAVLLDVDNGPVAQTQRANAWLYGSDGLRAIARALRPRGRLAVWSAGEDAAFARRLSDAGLQATTVRPAAKHGRGARHVIYLATRR